MATVADVVDAVIGVDTHADTLTAVIAGPSGAVRDWREVPADARGIDSLIGWALEGTTGDRLAFAIEGSRSYGIGLARAVAGLGLAVIEVERPSRTSRRGRGKSDRIDAELAARAALALDAAALPTPRADGDREGLRILLVARREMTTEKTAKTNRLVALLRTGSDSDRDLVRARLTGPALARITRRRARTGETREHTIRRLEATRLAKDILDLTQRLAANKTALRGIVADLSPGLLKAFGTGPVSAAQAIVSYSHHGRCRSEAAFAALAGASPLEASSGRTTRHRLNRGGDRHLNNALHTIAMTRMRSCARTRAYVERRRAEGLSDREIRRCLKRYIARELFKTLNTAAALDNT